MKEWINDLFGAPLKVVFHPMNDAIAGVYMPWARVCAVGLFLSAMLWVLLLRKEYVNLDAPKKVWYTDLRLWTILAMLPHVLIYLLV